MNCSELYGKHFLWFIGSDPSALREDHWHSGKLTNEQSDTYHLPSPKITPFQPLECFALLDVLPLMLSSPSEVYSRAREGSIIFLLTLLSAPAKLEAPRPQMCRASCFIPEFPLQWSSYMQIKVELHPLCDYPSRFVYYHSISSIPLRQNSIIDSIACLLQLQSMAFSTATNNLRHHSPVGLDYIRQRLYSNASQCSGLNECIQHHHSQLNSVRLMHATIYLARVHNIYFHMWFSLEQRRRQNTAAYQMNQATLLPKPAEVSYSHPNLKPCAISSPDSQIWLEFNCLEIGEWYIRKFFHPSCNTITTQFPRTEPTVSAPSHLLHFSWQSLLKEQQWLADVHIMPITGLLVIPSEICNTIAAIYLFSNTQGKTFVRSRSLRVDNSAKYHHENVLSIEHELEVDWKRKGRRIKCA